VPDVADAELALDGGGILELGHVNAVGEGELVFAALLVVGIALEGHPDRGLGLVVVVGPGTERVLVEVDGVVAALLRVDVEATCFPVRERLNEGSVGLLQLELDGGVVDLGIGRHGRAGQRLGQVGDRIQRACRLRCDGAEKEGTSPTPGRFLASRLEGSARPS